MTNVPSVKPPTYIVIGMAVVVILLVASMFIGCVSIPVHEAGLVQRYRQGGRDMAERIQKDLQNGTKEEVLDEIYNILGFYAVLDIKERGLR